MKFRRRIICSQAHYDLQDCKDKRSAGIGYGDKSDFTKSHVYAPSPDAYQSQSVFEKDYSTKKGKTFGIARDKMTEFGYITKGLLKNPGPGNYQHKGQMKTIGYSLRPKTANLYNPVFLNGKSSFLSNPGPGDYENKSTITQFGKQTVSNFRSSGATTINPPSSKRFAPIKNNAPGPGTYHPKNDLDNSGYYVLSTHKGSGSRLFPSQMRKSFTEVYSNKKFTPGPGNYRIPSDFGHYENFNMFKTFSDFNNSRKSFNRPNTAVSSNLSGVV